MQNGRSLAPRQTCGILDRQQMIRSALPGPPAALRMGRALLISPPPGRAPALAHLRLRPPTPRPPRMSLRCAIWLPSTPSYRRWNLVNEPRGEKRGSLMDYRKAGLRGRIGQGKKICSELMV
ncbi:MAG: hypothetical protein LUQ65_11645 [Candidatus Helarchaeota archaeon]|nr:hypothetical protein [Candidatus Helarchaeota archaeon]